MFQPGRRSRQGVMLAGVPLSVAVAVLVSVAVLV
jgi:hypothetical protein